MPGGPPTGAVLRRGCSGIGGGLVGSGDGFRWQKFIVLDIEEKLQHADGFAPILGMDEESRAASSFLARCGCWVR